MRQYLSRDSHSVSHQCTGGRFTAHGRACRPHSRRTSPLRGLSGPGLRWSKAAAASIEVTEKAVQMRARFRGRPHAPVLHWRDSTDNPRRKSVSVSCPGCKSYRRDKAWYHISLRGGKFELFQLRSPTSIALINARPAGTPSVITWTKWKRNFAATLL